MTREKMTVVHAVGSHGYYRLELVAERVVDAAEVDAADGPRLQVVEGLLVQVGDDHERQELRGLRLLSRLLGRGHEGLRIREPPALGGESERLLLPRQADHAVDVLGIRLLPREAQRRDDDNTPAEAGDEFFFGG